MFSRTYRAVAPIARLGVRCYATYRLDLVVALALRQAVPAVPVIGFILQRSVRLWVGARLANPAASEDIEDEQQASKEGPSAGPRPAGKQAGPRGLPALPPRPSAYALIPVPDHSTQLLGLPMHLLAQTAARVPLYLWQRNRLLRGLLGLAATFLLCRGFPTPFTGRKAWLPPQMFEQFYHKLQGASPGERQLCAKYEPAIRDIYQRMREAGASEAKRLGRSVAFAAPGAEGSVQAIHNTSVNACCLPGGIAFVKSGLIGALGGSQQALAFVVGHEVGHAIGRHSLEKAALVYGGMFAIDTVVGLLQHLLEHGGRGTAGSTGWRQAHTHPTLASSISLALPGGTTSALAASARMAEGVGQDEGEEECGEGLGAGACRLLRALDSALQSMLYMVQLQQSRQHEYEADALSLHLGTRAGMDRSWLASGAQLTLRQFIRIERRGTVQVLGGPTVEQADNPLSTHPAAVNRLRRLVQLFKGGGTSS